MQEKKCTKCGKNKDINEYNLDKRHKDGKQSQCKECQNKYGILCYKASPLRKNSVKERARLRYYDNTEMIKESVKEWALNNPEKVKKIKKKWELNNKDKKKSYNDIWRKINPDKVKEKNKRCYVKQQGTSSGKLNNSMSSGIYVSLKKGSKAGRHWETLVGYTVDQLKEHLEKQFKPGMNWENRSQWHIDHIIPLSVHNFQSPEDIDFKKAWSLKNLQPMWAKENIKKSNKLSKPFQPSLTL